MKTFNLKGTKRTETGKKSTKQLRKEDRVPCVLYGGDEVVHFSIDATVLRHIVYTPSVFLLKVEVDGAAYDAVLQDLQFHPVSDKVLHVDFYRVFEDKPLTMSIPAVITGNSDGVKAGGKLQVNMRKLKVRGLAAHMPDTLKIDITTVGLGQSVKVGSLHFENLTVLDPANAVVCGVRLTRAARGAAQTSDAKK